MQRLSTCIIQLTEKIFDPLDLENSFSISYDGLNFSQLPALRGFITPPRKLCPGQEVYISSPDKMFLAYMNGVLGKWDSDMDAASLRTMNMKRLILNINRSPAKVC